MTNDFRWLIALGSFCIACSGEEVTGPEGNPSRNVTQGGPQDVAEFRAVVARGQVPALDLLDQVGFFAEHAIDLPAAECAGPVCVHPMLAVAPRFDGGNWSMAFIGLNTALDPETIPKPPRHLLLVLEHSARTNEIFNSMVTFSLGLGESLSADDRVSVIVAGSSTTLLAEGIAEAELSTLGLPALANGTNGADLYAAMQMAYDVATREEFSPYSQRVLFVSSGITDRGIEQIDRFTALGAELARAEVAISSFGVGATYRRDIPAALAEVGSGNYYYSARGVDLLDALAVEGATAFIPLARDASFTLEAQPGYRVGRVYGARRMNVNDTTAVLSSPVLFMGAREGSSDMTHGRRGGGGGWFVELLADTEPGYGETVEADTFAFTAAYENPETGERVEQAELLSNPLGVGQNPPPDAPFFSQPTYAKPFMMLNMYLALYTAVSLYESGECGLAQGVLPMMKQSYDYWNAVYDDADIDADYLLLDQLTRVIETSCEAMVAQPVEVPYSCFMF